MTGRSVLSYTLHVMWFPDRSPEGFAVRMAGLIVTFAVATTFAACTGQASKTPVSLAGHWCASVALSESERVTLIVDLERSADGFTGEFDTPEFGVENYPVAATVDGGGGVHMVFSGPEAEFSGRIAEGDSILAGTIVFGEESYAVRLRREGPVQFSPLFLELNAAAEDPTRVTPLSADFAELRAAFNRAADRTRLVLLLSPT